MVHFTCTNPACRQTLRVGDDLAGRRVKCPSCGTVCEVPVPVAEAVGGPGAAVPPPVAAPRRAVQAPPVHAAPQALDPSPGAALDELMASIAPSPSAPSAPPPDYGDDTSAQPLRGGKGRPVRKDRTPLIAFGVCFVATVIVGAVLYLTMVRDTWEADHSETLLALADEVHHAVAAGRYDQARAKYDELQALAAGHTIKDDKLQKAFEQAKSDIKTAQGQPAAPQAQDVMAQIEDLRQRMEQRSAAGDWQDALDRCSDIIFKLEEVKATQPQAAAAITGYAIKRRDLQAKLDAAQRAAREEAARAAAKARQPAPQPPKDPRSEDPAGQYARRFAADVDRAVATPETADDLAIGEKMIAEAAGASAAAAYQQMLYEKAWPLCAKDPAGRAKAIDVLVTLEKASPDRRAEYLAARADLLDQVFRAASGTGRRPAAEAYLGPLTDLADLYLQRERVAKALETYRRALLVAQYLQSPQEVRLKEAIAKCQTASTPRELASETIKTLKDRLQADPADAPSRTQLIYLLLTEANDPQAAEAASHPSLETTLAVNLALAAKGINEVSEASCLSLGQWYASTLLKQATAPAKPAVAERAKGYYRQFLKLHTAQDAAAEQAKAALNALEKNYPLKK
ncbi:MAG: hypothetical protein LLG01_17340 [Planctomycetaceae bacterium]|nr:hypothetical protein [Planctomycetaceae bacterium]